MQAQTCHHRLCPAGGRRHELELEDLIDHPMELEKRQEGRAPDQVPVRLVLGMPCGKSLGEP